MTKTWIEEQIKKQLQIDIKAEKVRCESCNKLMLKKDAQLAQIDEDGVKAPLCPMCYQKAEEI